MQLDLRLLIEDYVCLFGVFHHTRIFHSYRHVTIAVEGCKVWPMLGTRSHWYSYFVFVSVCVDFLCHFEVIDIKINHYGGIVLSANTFRRYVKWSDPKIDLTHPYVDLLDLLSNCLLFICEHWIMKTCNCIIMSDWSHPDKNIFLTSRHYDNKLTSHVSAKNQHNIWNVDLHVIICDVDLADVNVEFSENVLTYQSLMSSRHILWWQAHCN